MPARRKTLEELVAGRSFLARRHGDRLLEPLLARADLRTLQDAYRAASPGGVRRAIALAFEGAQKVPAREPTVAGVADATPERTATDPVEPAKSALSQSAEETRKLLRVHKRRLAEKLIDGEDTSAAELAAILKLEVTLQQLADFERIRAMTRRPRPAAPRGTAP